MAADRGSRLYTHVDRLHELADALERRLDGDATAFGPHQVLDLIRTGLTVQDSLHAIEALSTAGQVVRLEDRRTR